MRALGTGNVARGGASARTLVASLLVIGAPCCTTFGGEEVAPDAGPTDAAASPRVDGGTESDASVEPKDASTDAPRTFYWAYVSPDTFDGDMASGTAALPRMDDYCTKVGKAAFGGSETAKFLVYLGPGAASRFVGLGPWRLPGGDEIFASQGDFAGGAKIRFNQLPDGKAVQAPYFVWTGMSQDGSPGQACPNWASRSSDHMGAVGSTDAVRTGWQHVGTQPCSTPARVYCLEVSR